MRSRLAILSRIGFIFSILFVAACSEDVTIEPHHIVNNCSGPNGYVNDNEWAECCKFSGLPDAANSSCHDENGAFTVSSDNSDCKAWFDGLTDGQKGFISGSQCDTLVDEEVDGILQDAGEEMHLAETGSINTNLGESESGGVAQDQTTPESAAAIAGSGIEAPVEETPTPQSLADIAIPDFTNGAAPGSSLSGNGSGPSGFGSGGLSTGPAKGAAAATAAEAIPEDLATNATLSGAGVGLAGKKSKKTGNFGALKKFFGSQGRSGNKGGKSGGLLEFGDTSGERTPASDPADYFGRIPPIADLFKVVEKRYRSESLKWREANISSLR